MYNLKITPHFNTVDIKMEENPIWNEMGLPSREGHQMELRLVPPPVDSHLLGAIVQLDLPANPESKVKTD